MDVETTILARAELHMAAALRAAYNATHDEAVKAYGKGPLTSGIGNATTAPAAIKAKLRGIDRMQAALLDSSLALWVGAGSRLTTWRRLKEEILP